MPWSEIEVEVTVADYFAMLDLDIRGRDYNKAAHNRALRAQLNNRSPGAVERKHQNISAALIELGFPYISGYKPLANYQKLLFQVVEARLRHTPGIVRLVERQVEAPVGVPEIEEILKAFQEPPTPLQRAIRTAGGIRERQPPVDYLAIEARNRSLGAAGEEFAIRYERARLIAAGKGRLAASIERVSEKNESAGYDILSFDNFGRELFIEVKTTNYGPAIPFYVSGNELAVSKEYPTQYRLYRAYDFRVQPKLFAKAGALDSAFKLEPDQYLAFP